MVKYLISFMATPLLSARDPGLVSAMHFGRPLRSAGKCFFTDFRKNTTHKSNTYFRKKADQQLPTGLWWPSDFNVHLVADSSALIDQSTCPEIVAHWLTGQAIDAM